MQSCLVGAPQLAEWMKQHPAERLAAWRCVIGKRDGRELSVEAAFPREFAANFKAADTARTTAASAWCRSDS
jgi:hypothetical protein